MGTSAGAIVSSKGGEINKCYYLDGVAVSFKGIGKDDAAGSAESRTAAQFKDGTVSKDLGDAFTQIGDFPELKALLKKYELTVKSGTDVIGEGSYLPGTVITIKADAAPSGKTFDKWTSNDANVVFADASKAETTITMPARKVTVTATYKEKLPVPGDPGTITVSFTLLGDEVHGKPTEKTGTHTLTANNLAPWYSASITIQKSGTVKDVLDAVAKQTNIVFSNPSGNYVDGVTYKGITIEQFSNGTLSGWMYTLNGTHPLLGVKEQHLNNGDKIVFHYTDDYTKEEGSDKWNTPGGDTDDIKNVTTDTKAGTTTSPTEVKVSEKINADGAKQKVVEVTVSADNQKEILKQAKDNKSGEIILVVSKDYVKDATKADIKLDKSFIDSLVKDTNAKLTVKTPFGDKTYTQDELKALSEAEDGSMITITIEKAEEPADDAVKAEKIAKAKKLTASMKLMARTEKTAKKNIKVTVKTNSETTASIKELKDLGYTVKYRYYRSAKKAAGYKSAVTKTSKSYINTAGTKGKMYYYKAQVRVYDENGKLIAKTALKQCKYANRKWSK